MKFLLILFSFLLPSAALAQNPVALTSEVFVERVSTGANGDEKVSLEAPNVVIPGDKLVFVLSYRNGGTTPAADFVVTNPIPGSVSFAGTESSGAAYSVDGGKSWGALTALTIANPDGTRRAATLADVTHVRWHFAQPIAPGGSGQLRFRGVVK